MKSFFLSKLFYALLIPAAMLFSFATVIDKTNFTGNWKLDEAKSDLGDFGAFAARSIKAEQKDSSITISRTINGFGGGEPITATVTIFYDGRVTESEGFGGSKTKSTAKWSDDGQAFTITSVIIFDMNGQSNEIKIAETWSLTKEGLLSLVANSTGPNGDATTKAIYAK